MIMSNYKALLEEINAVIKNPSRVEDKMAQTCDALLSVEDFDMVGFYLIDPDGPSQLVKGPHMGLPNTHTIIPIGKGLCGQVAERQVTIVLDDVNDELNYISVHEDVKSEIALPIFRQGQLSGLLDVISKRQARFDQPARLFLEEVSLLMTDRI
jgi:L-methionine (R)-S-oxide reductase